AFVLDLRETGLPPVGIPEGAGAAVRLVHRAFARIAAVGESHVARGVPRPALRAVVPLGAGQRTELVGVDEAAGGEVFPGFGGAGQAADLDAHLRVDGADRVPGRAAGRRLGAGQDVLGVL